MDVNAAVQDRYSEAAQDREEALCCPITNYDPQFLSVIPQEVIDRDYGCGDPSLFVQEGDTVLDLGSGGGKICFITSQIVGEQGQVIGVDRNRDMLDLARRSQKEVAKAIGFDNCSFRVGNIQDLGLNLELVEEWLEDHPVNDRESLLELQAKQAELRKTQPLIEDESVDVVVSNCVLNLVANEDRHLLFRELYRVVKDGGRVAISDIVCDEPVPQHLQDDPELWSGCISGAFEEKEFLDAFADAGFHGVHFAKRESQPWQVVEGIEFRSVTVVAYKGKVGACLDAGHAVMYPGPWKEVHDDDGHVFKRGDRVAVCEKTYKLLTSEPYNNQLIGLPPYAPIPNNLQKEMTCDGYQLRPVHETKNAPTTYQYAVGCCTPGSGCC